MASIRDSWNRIETWLSESMPDESLPIGATGADIANVERGLGMSIPKTLRELFQIHDGSNRISLCEGGFIMPLADTRKLYKRKPPIGPNGA